MVRDRSLSHALSEAYRGLLMVGRLPRRSFLHLEIPPEEVDVNIHPTKAEVRFRDAQRIYSQLLSTIRQTFLTSDLHAKLQASEPFEAPASESCPWHRCDSSGRNALRAGRGGRPPPGSRLVVPDRASS